MTISVAVMAHRSREAMVAELVERLDCNPVVVWDTINDRHDTGVRSIEAYDPACTHHLVIQDDAVPCRDLVAGLEAAVAARSEVGVGCLYVGRVRPFASKVDRAVRGARRSVSWLTMAGVYWGPAILYPTAEIPGLVAWYRRSSVTNYDRRVSTYFAGMGATVWYPWPSLVDHRDSASLVNGRGSGRVAHTFIGADASALDVDWSGGVVAVPGTERADAMRQQLARQ